MEEKLNTEKARVEDLEKELKERDMRHKKPLQGLKMRLE